MGLLGGLLLGVLLGGLHLLGHDSSDALLLLTEESAEDAVLDSRVGLVATISTRHSALVLGDTSVLNRSQGGDLHQKRHMPTWKTHAKMEMDLISTLTQ